MLLRERVKVHSGDCLVVLDGMDASHFDAVVTDPPYHFASIVARFGSETAAPAQYGSDGAFQRASRGFMGKEWDGGDIAFRPETWAKVLRVMKPGAHLVAFGAPKNYHRLACAIEDAGFEVRDSLMWVFGTGFPKSLDVSKAIDRSLGLQGVYGEPKSAAHAGWIDRGRMRGDEGHEGFQRPWMQDEEAVDRAARKYEPASEHARQFQGWGTALKPAYEPIVLARKPLSEKTVAANVQRWGTGAINIDATRIGNGEKRKTLSGGMAHKANPIYGSFANSDVESIETTLGRWPANLCHDGSDEVIAGFPNDSARFFYCAKASKSDRAGSKHPTVKPLPLMRWLVRMVTPPNGTVLDPFGGSGTTGQAAFEEGFDSVLIEREYEYVADIQRRMECAGLV